MTQIARRTGWGGRRRLHMIESKVPDAQLVRDPQSAYGYEPYETWPTSLFEDACEGWHGCGINGCCVDEDWAVNVMPPTVFMQEGIVHITKPKDLSALCGEAGNWPMKSFQSTDEAQAFAARSRNFSDVTCLPCIASAHFWDVRWLP